ncbi:GerAB/ArcD/ProY family transporter [Fodinisporobacter ferrooxydans]|uniref:GerAB/ArcD/ProY family transporter n=2 Tax=Fodinisporobacter ferrooxydans TaxID=2901836 RepID=A0ABY4CI09_9BACL|nr:GerAB/ArcD/ProY family transporter [Alicyclobacillaceae bacterium MYW30-H2]
MNYPILNIGILPLMIRVAGKDLWISTLLSSTIGLLIALLLWDLEKKNPEQTCLDMLKTRPGGHIIIWVLVPILILYLWLLCVLASVSLTEFISIGFIQETPFWVIALIFGLCIAYSLRKGMTSLADLAGVLTLSTILSGTTMSIAISGKRHVSYFLPIGEHGIYPILLGVVLFVPIWTELFFLGFMPRDFVKGKGWIKTYFWIVLINTIIFVGHSEGPITAFGLGQAKNFNFPELSAVKVISLGFIDRFDVYGLLLMLYGSFIRVSFYSQLSLSLICRMFPSTKIRISPMTSTILPIIFLITGTIWLFRNTAFFHGLLQPFIRISLSMFALFLVIYLFIRFTKPHQVFE